MFAVRHKGEKKINTFLWMYVKRWYFLVFFLVSMWRTCYVLELNLSGHPPRSVSRQYICMRCIVYYVINSSCCKWPHCRINGQTPEQLMVVSTTRLLMFLMSEQGCEDLIMLYNVCLETVGVKNRAEAMHKLASVFYLNTRKVWVNKGYDEHTHAPQAMSHRNVINKMRCSS